MSKISQLTQFNFYPTLHETAGLSLIYFFSASCGSCRHLGEVLSQLGEEKPPLQLFKVDAQQDQALASEFEIFHLPAMFLFKDGEYHAEIHAEARIAAIMDAVNRAATAPAEEAP